jgi:predicted DNA-binding transcriptional regulator AlpA
MSSDTGRELPRASPDADTVYLNAAQVRRRYGGMSEMALWRWLQDETLGFPKPLIINNRRFWSAAALTAWERKHAAKGGKFETNSDDEWEAA